MPKTKSSLLFLFIIFFLVSCEKKQDKVINATFEQYVDRFFEEAQSRGHLLRREDFSFSVNFGVTSSGNIAGTCTRPGNDIIVNRLVWKDYDDLAREDLIFHEMGHCILKREHDNQILDHGECKSIMKGTEDNRTCFRNRTGKIWRDYYLDELFEVNTPIPEWYVDNVLTTAKKELLSFDAEVGTLLSKTLTDFDANKNFEIIGTFTKNNDNTWIELSWGEYLFIFRANTALIEKNSDIIYANVNWSTFFSTEFKVVQKGEFLYFMVDGKMFHIDAKQNNPFSFIRINTNAADFNDKITASIAMNEIE